MYFLPVKIYELKHLIPSAGDIINGNKGRDGHFARTDLTGVSAHTRLTLMSPRKAAPPLFSKSSSVCRHAGITYVHSWPLGAPEFTIYGACVCVAVCVFYTVVEEDDPLARGLYIPCPDHYKNYCIHGDCQFPNILAQPSCRYTHTHTHNKYLSTLSPLNSFSSHYLVKLV